jgi:hypothetical protein
MEAHGWLTLPVNAGRDVNLAILSVIRSLVSQIKINVSNLTVEIVLVQIPFVSIASRDIKIRVNNSNSSEIVGTRESRRID